MARRAEIKVSCISEIISVLLCRTLKPNVKFSGNLWVQQRQRTNRTPYADLWSTLHSLQVKKIWLEMWQPRIIWTKACRVICASLFKKKVLHVNGLILKFSLLQDAHIWHDLVSSPHARNEIEGVFAPNSKYVVCFKKVFAGKGDLYEFIMFYDMRA